MLASELIKELEKAIDDHGDLPVNITLNCGVNGVYESDILFVDAETHKDVGGNDIDEITIKDTPF